MYYRLPTIDGFTNELQTWAVERRDRWRWIHWVSMSGVALTGLTINIPVCPGAYLQPFNFQSLPPMSLVPPNPEADTPKPTVGSDICTAEHCFHAFDALYCALTSAPPIAPQFANDK
jgi:hypothetical protein